MLALILEDNESSDINNLIQTKARWRSRLPHWEVGGHWHFITIRCQGTLPKDVCKKIRDIHKSLCEIEASDPGFAQLQRQYFLTAEKYLDRGEGFAPFVRSEICQSCLSFFAELEKEGWETGGAVLMPNHVHFLIMQTETAGLPLKEALQRFKGRTARNLNKLLNRTGRFWQEDWFDRWMRNEEEVRRTIGYIRNNPVKARLVLKPQDYTWRISRLT